MPKPSPSHIFFWHMYCRTPWKNDQLIRRPMLGTTKHVKTRNKHPCPKQHSNQQSQQPGGQDFHLRLHSHRDWHIHDLLSLLKWLRACIHFRCEFCPQVKQNVSLITAWNKSYYSFLGIRDFRAGHLRCLKNERLHSPSDQQAGKRLDRFCFSFVLQNYT